MVAFKYHEIKDYGTVYRTCISYNVTIACYTYTVSLSFVPYAKQAHRSIGSYGTELSFTEQQRFVIIAIINKITHLEPTKYVFATLLQLRLSNNNSNNNTYVMLFSAWGQLGSQLYVLCSIIRQ